MVSFSLLDIFIILLFFILLIIIGLIPKKEKKGDSEGYLLSNRKVGLTLFIMSNVAAWYGGILGVGEFTYRYGLLSWFTQGFPYYIFAILFAVFFAKKIRDASLFTISDKLEQTYGKNVGVASSIIVFILVSPAPYLLMVGNLISLMFNIPLFIGLCLGVIISGGYLIKGGYKSDLFINVYQFVIMFVGFILALIVSVVKYGGYNYLEANLPPSHLSLTGNVSLVYVIVWFLIALWTFADPGFHQRCNAAKSGEIARKGILISVILFAVFDFLTTATGLYTRAVLPNLSNPVLSFPFYAEKALGSGVKGLFYAAMFATIISTFNSFLFLSATTFGRDFVFKISKAKDPLKINYYTRIGLIISSIVAVTASFFVQSVISLWYIAGSIFIPPIIILITGAYFERFLINKTFAMIEIIVSIFCSILWLSIKNYFEGSIVYDIEPMIIGLISALLVHLIGMKKISGLRVKPLIF